jgi:DNA-binding MarR family transcriptional regulator
MTRAQLVVPTDEGRGLFEQALALQRPWAADLAECLTEAQGRAACDALDVQLDRLDTRAAS